MNLHEYSSMNYIKAMGNSQASDLPEPVRLMDSTMKKFKHTPEKCTLKCRSFRHPTNPKEISNIKYVDKILNNWNPYLLSRSVPVGASKFEGQIYSPLFVGKNKPPGVLYTWYKNKGFTKRNGNEYEPEFNVHSDIVQCTLECD